jgi:hypothetical protein
MIGVEAGSTDAAGMTAAKCEGRGSALELVGLFAVVPAVLNCIGDALSATA